MRVALQKDKSAGCEHKEALPGESDPVFSRGSRLPAVAGLALFIGYGLWRGCRLRELACMCARGVASARGVLESFVLIGALTALWRACGTVSEVVVLAAPLVRPAVAPLAVFCMCSLMSFLIGTSFGTAATMGVSIALAALVCAAARRMSAGQIASVCVLGFTPADPTVAELMSGGGVVSMCGAPAACWCAAFYLWLIPIWRLTTEAAGTRFGFDGGEGARSAEAAENSSRAHA